MSYLREETTKNIINLNQKEIALPEQKESKKVKERKNIKISTENNKINKEIKMQKNIIDLKEINELSYSRIGKFMQYKLFTK